MSLNTLIEKGCLMKQVKLTKKVKQRPKKYEKPLSLYSLGMEKVLKLALNQA
jgi:hypothetical protein